MCGLTPISFEGSAVLQRKELLDGQAAGTDETAQGPFGNFFVVGTESEAICPCLTMMM
jgi:hypothetical protein